MVVFYDRHEASSSTLDIHAARSSVACQGTFPYEVIIVRTWTLFLLGAVIAFATLVALEGIISTPVWAVLAGLLVVLLGLGSKFVATHERRRRRADRTDSIEYANAQHAAAATFPFGLLLLVALGALLVFQESYQSAVLVYGATVVFLAAYWVNYLRIWRRV